MREKLRKATNSVGLTLYPRGARDESKGFTLYPRGGRDESKGFTLIELLIVMALLIVTGTLIVGILNSTLRGSNKTRTTSDLAQNGNYALSIITNILINAQEMLSFTATDGTVLSDCTSGGGSHSGKTMQVLNFDNGVTTLTCDDFENFTISSSSAVFSSSVPTPTPFSTSALIDKSRVTVVANGCAFVCSQPDVYTPPRIDIRFRLQNANAIPGESNNTVLFNTSVTLRNHSVQ